MFFLMRLLPVAAVFTSFLIGFDARAATLTISPSRPAFQTGEYGSLSIIGDAEDAMALSLFGQLDFDPAALLMPGVITFPVLSTPPVNFDLLPLGPSGVPLRSLKLCGPQPQGA